MTVPGRAALIDVAMGYAPADAVIVNGRVVDVHTGTVRTEDIAIKDGRIAAVGAVEYSRGDSTCVVDAVGDFSFRASSTRTCISGTRTQTRPYSQPRTCSTERQRFATVSTGTRFYRRPLRCVFSSTS